LRDEPGDTRRVVGLEACEARLHSLALEMFRRGGGDHRVPHRDRGDPVDRLSDESVVVDTGSLDDARELLVQSLHIDLELGNLPFVSLDLVRFAVIQAREGNPTLAARLIARAVTVFQEIGLSLESWMTRELDDATAAVRAQLDENSFDAAWAEGAKMSLDDAVALALGTEP